MLKWLLLAVPVLAGAGLALAYSQGQFPGQDVDGDVLVLVGGRVYDPIADSLLYPATVVIRGRELVEVGPDATIPDGSRSLYVNGLTLLPGFIDSHVHLSGIRVRPSDGTRELGALAYFWRYLRRFPDRRRRLIRAGITSVKSLGDPYPWVTKLADRIERHELAGPRIFAAGPIFTAPGGHPVSRLRSAGQGDTSFIAQVTRQVSERTEAESAVEAIAGGVDYLSVAIESPGNPGLPTLTPPLLEAITRSAHERDRPVLVHVSTLGQLALALSVGADGIEHAPHDGLIEPAVLEEMRARHLFVDPTLQAADQYLGATLGDTAAARRARANTRRLQAAGVPLVVGSDAPSPGTSFGRSFHEELRNLVETGYTPGQAIAAATSAAAEHLGMADRLGRIAPGMLADVIAVGGEPLVDVAWAADIYLVIADGQVLIDRLDQVRRRGGVIALGHGERNRAPPRRRSRALGR